MNRRDFLQLAGAGALGLALNPTLPIPAKAQTGNILVVVGMDGVGLNVIQEMVAAGRMPNMERLITRGCLMPLDSTGATITIPNWAKLATGIEAPYTGNFGNTPYQGQLLTERLIDPWIWLRQIHCSEGNESIFRAVQVAGHVTAWHVSKPYLSSNFNLGPFARMSRLMDDYILFRPFLEPLTYMEQLTDHTLAFIQEQTGGFLAFCHQNQDNWGHKYGSRSPEFFAEVERGDYNLGRIMALQESLGFPLAVVSDHGFDEPGPDDPPEGPHGHKNAPFQFLATDLPINPRWHTGGAKMTDLAMTILAYFGLPPHHPRAWGRDLRV